VLTDKEGKLRKNFVLRVVFLIVVIGLVGAGTIYHVVKISRNTISQSISEPSIVYDRNGEVVARFFIENGAVPREEYNLAPYFVSHILFNELLPRYGAERVYTGGLRVHTTIDLRLQQKAQEVIRSLRTQGALVALEARWRNAPEGVRLPHHPQVLSIRLRKALRAVLRYDVIVLNPQAAPAFYIYTGLYRDYVPRLQGVLRKIRYTRRFVHLEPQPVPQPVNEIFFVPCVGYDPASHCVDIFAGDAWP